jgi:hypothetical protein
VPPAAPGDAGKRRLGAAAGLEVLTGPAERLGGPTLADAFVRLSTETENYVTRPPSMSRQYNSFEEFWEAKRDQRKPIIDLMRKQNIPMVDDVNQWPEDEFLDLVHTALHTAAEYQGWRSRGGDNQPDESPGMGDMPAPVGI